jgi:hypothetical protein
MYEHHNETMIAIADKMTPEKDRIAESLLPKMKEVSKKLLQVTKR